MKNNLRNGLFFSAMGQYANVLMQFLINVILSHLVTPKAYGLMATVQIFIIFFQIFAGLSVVPAIVQSKTIEKKDYGILFNYSLMIGLILSIVFGLLGGVFSHLFNDSSYRWLTWLLSPLVFTEFLNMVPNAILTKEKRFKELNIRLIFSVMVGAMIGIFGAFHGWGIYALIIVNTLPFILSALLNFFIVKIQWTLSFEFSAVQKILFFARHQAGFLFITYLYRNLDNFLVAKFQGAASLGYYSKGYYLATYPSMVLSEIISPVLQANLAEHENNIVLIKNAYLQITHVLALLLVPLSVFLSANAGRIITFLFGPQWKFAGPPFAALALSLWAQVLVQLIGVIWQSRNLPKWQMRNGIFSFALVATGILIGVMTGQLVGVAAGVAIAQIFNFFMSQTFLFKIGLQQKSVVSHLKNLLKPFLFGVATFVEMVAFDYFLIFSNAFVTLIARFVLWCLFLFILLFITGDLGRIKSLFQK